jgi:hypothetical protein
VASATPAHKLQEVVVVKPIRLILSMTVAIAVLALGLFPSGAAASSGPARSQHAAINCANSSAMCTEVANSDDVFGHYVGHDEPSVLFDSNLPGSGNHMRYDINLPSDPSAQDPNAPGKSYNFELSGATWLGMALCDTQSYPEQVKTCPPDSNANILDPAVSPKHVGQAYMEMQFYPPGWIPWPTWQQAVGASSCDATHWCAALNVDSLSLNPVTGQTNNEKCLKRVGEEYLNFAFITKNGVAQAPANPVDSTLDTFTPNPSRDLFMNSGDHLQVAFNDTPDGLKVSIEDLTTGGTGSMTASAANGFAQVKFAPEGDSCTAIPYDFHPMYSTSSPETRVTWAAGGYNVAYDTEIGHFQKCNGPVPIPSTPFGLTDLGAPVACPIGDTENDGGTPSIRDDDDLFCFPGSQALVFKVSGCTYTNTGFDGVSYQPVWPDGNTALHPSPAYFASPETGANYDQQYQTAGLEADLPAIEATCNTETRVGCSHIPTTDNGTPAAFYPFYTTSDSSNGCVWAFGNNLPGQISNFGGNDQYGSLLPQTYTTEGGGSRVLYNDFQSRMPNPCPQG